MVAYLVENLDEMSVVLKAEHLVECLAALKVSKKVELKAETMVGTMDVMWELL
jgi:hypothetical protein